MTALEWFDKAIEREKKARKAKGLSEQLGADVIRMLAKCAEKAGTYDEGK